jgi:hypothetical protein
VSGDTLVNAERPASERPAPSGDNLSDKLGEGYWLGSAAGEVRRWRERALRAEAALAELRKGLTGWRYRP